MNKRELTGVMYTTSDDGMHEYQVKYDRVNHTMYYFLNDELICQESDELSDEELEIIDKNDYEFDDEFDGIFDWYYSEFLDKLEEFENNK